MIRREVIFSPEAENDLLEIYEWIAERANEHTALAYVERIEAHCLGFDLASERGSRRDDVRPGLRIVGFGRNLTIAFAVDDTMVTILRFFRRGRDWTQSSP